MASTWAAILTGGVHNDVSTAYQSAEWQGSAMHVDTRVQDRALDVMPRRGWDYSVACSINLMTFLGTSV